LYIEDSISYTQNINDVLWCLRLSLMLTILTLSILWDIPWNPNYYIWVSEH